MQYEGRFFSRANALCIICIIKVSHGTWNQSKKLSAIEVEIGPNLSRKDI